MDQPHEMGMILTEPPVCDRCIESPDSIAKLEQHASVLREIPQAPPKVLSSVAPSNLALPAAQPSNRRPPAQSHLRKEQGSRPQDTLQCPQQSRPLPAWMSLLPSNINPHVKPPSNSNLSRRMTFPSYPSSSNSTPYVTPLEWPISHDDYDSNDLSTPPHLSLDGDTTPKGSYQLKRHSSTELASLLGYTQEIFSLKNAIRSIDIPPQPTKDIPLVQKPANRRPTPHGTITAATSSSLKSAPSIHPPANYGRNPRATSSEAHLPSHNRHVPLQSSISTFPPANRPSIDPGTTIYCRYLRATSSEACLPSFYSPSASPTRHPNPFTQPKTLTKTPRNSKTAPTCLKTPASRSQPHHQNTNKPIPAFLKELSTFFATRNGNWSDTGSASTATGVSTKLILPSRAVEGRGIKVPKIGIGFGTRFQMRIWDCADGGGCEGCGAPLFCTEGCEDGRGDDGAQKGDGRRTAKRRISEECSRACGEEKCDVSGQSNRSWKDGWSEASGRVETCTLSSGSSGSRSGSKGVRGGGGGLTSLRRYF
jgi:hypothetical protein